MIKEQDIVTKKFLADQLMSQKIEILEEVRAEIHSALDSATKNMKAYYRRESKHQMGALLDGVRDEMRAYRDGMKMHQEKLDNHELRLERASL